MNAGDVVPIFQPGPDGRKILEGHAVLVKPSGFGQGDPENPWWEVKFLGEDQTFSRCVHLADIRRYERELDHA